MKKNIDSLILEKQIILIEELIKSIGSGIAIFGIPKLIAGPLIEDEILHKDTFKYTGGCIINRKTYQNNIHKYQSK